MTTAPELENFETYNFPINDTETCKQSGGPLQNPNGNKLKIHPISPSGLHASLLCHPQFQDKLHQEAASQ